MRVFISSPADVRPERLIAERVVQRLAREFAYRLRMEPVLWEREPLVAGEHFQDRITPPHECDITVVILWSRLGVTLPEDKYRGALTTRAVTGTEWEFEDALASYREKKLPDLLLYRKKTKVAGSLDDEALLQQQIAQKRLVEDFFLRWTRTADGASFTAALWEFDDAAAFEELLEQHVRELVRRRLSDEGEAPGGIRWHQGSPFRGLQAFELEHAAVFFGRTRARNELRELLARQEGRGCAFVLVMGASGSGKSSLVKAGLLPDLKLPGMVGRVALCRHAVMTPGTGDNPLGALAAALLQPTALPELESLQYDPASLAALLGNGAAQVLLPVRQGLAAAGKAANLVEHAEARLLLVVDQLEELFTRDGITDADREAFVDALDALAKSRLVWVVATMRSDFFDRLERLPRLLALSAGEARYLVAPPEPAEIAQMIRQPAREAGLRFEDDAARGIGLDEVIQKAAARDPGALPLLSFLLDQLWHARSDRGVLTFAAYETLGGLEGSLGRRADEVFAALPADVQRALPEVLRALVTVGAEAVGARRPATARTAPMAAFPEGTPRRRLLEALLDPKARLVVAQADERGAQVRVAHEALLSHWGIARKQIEDDARDLQLRARLEQSAQLWQEAPKKHRSSLLLPAGLQLDEARDLVRRWRDGIDAGIVAFVEASRAAARRRVMRVVGIGVGGILAVPLLAALAWLVLVWRGVQAFERDLVLVPSPAGAFMMGSPEGEPNRMADEGPVREVRVPAFLLSKVEVKQEEWQAIMLERPSGWPGPNRPVESVAWNDVQVFIGRLNRVGSRVYRLPTESEWEYAARAGTTTAYVWGTTAEPEGCKYANFSDQSWAAANPRETHYTPLSAKCNDGQAQTAPVGSFPPNKFGVHDMQGNVWEWVQDNYHRSYEGAPSDGSAWLTGEAGGDRVIRGGSFHSIPARLRSAQRNKEPAHFRNHFIGFRVASSVPRK